MTTTAQQWRTPRKVPAGKFVVAAVVVLLTAYGADHVWQVVVAALVAAGVVGWAVRDLRAPVPLTADADGVTVRTGFSGRRWVPWSGVARVRVDVRRRSRMLEVDTGDRLYLFSRYDLDVDLDDVAATLERLRSQ